MGVDRCICHRVSFKQLLDLSSKIGKDFDKLAAATKCGSQCGMCVPYIYMALDTGKSRVPVLSEQQAAAIIASKRGVTA